MTETQNMGVTAEELDDLAWALYEAFPEVAREVNPAHSPDFWPAKATQLLPVINKIRERARQEGREEGRAPASCDVCGRDDVVECIGGEEYYCNRHRPGREVTLDEALEKTIIHEEGCGWETGPYCTCGADPARMENYSAGD